jgi:methylthioribose-1-phosphate isomerase
MSLSIPQASLWLDDNERSIHIIDQTRLPHELDILNIQTLDEICHAIVSMQVRGAPLIGITAAFGFAFALRDTNLDSNTIADKLLATRPTAVNLHWAVNRIQQAIANCTKNEREQIALETAKAIWHEDKAMCHAIGEYGLDIIRQLSQKKSGTLNILTHCNAGWLATGEWGTALAPIYKAQQAGINIHVWVDETRPRNQGYLTSWELTQANVPHTLIVDNTGGHLMQHGLVDLCIVGSDRTTAQGDVCNKIGTYLKALAAHDNNIPFYAALPSSTIDWSIDDGIRQIPIEKRSDEEIRHIYGLDISGKPVSITAVPETTKTENHAFDVTPASYISGLITEKGVFGANREQLARLKQSLSV